MYLLKNLPKISFGKYFKLLMPYLDSGDLREWYKSAHVLKKIFNTFIFLNH